MNKLFLGLLLGSVTFCVNVACAENLKLSGHKRWLAVASTKNLNDAIGIARTLGGEGSRVVSSESGYFGIVLGPYAVKSVEYLKRKNENLSQLPKDALLSNGARYLETVWSAPPLSSIMSDYEKDKPVQLSSGDFSVTAKLEKIGDDQYSSVVSGGQSSGPQFSFDVGKEGEYADLGSQAALIQLDGNSKIPQVVFTRFSGGAHCCTNTWVITKQNGAEGWALNDLGKLDGGGYWYEDVDGDGGKELLSVDNVFLYTFDSYAGSFAPLRISKLREGNVEDVSEEAPMRSRLLQDLAGHEFQAKVNPDLWKSNGFLAAWVASKIRLGEGADAWSTAMQSYDKNSGFDRQECMVEKSVDDCPADQLKSIPFPRSLAGFLKENGYGPLPDEAKRELN